ncbi:MAG: TPM domain-containing protein, partial [Alphaproteobacteria bacterium]
MLIWGSAAPLSVLAQSPFPERSGYVIDAANILPAEAEARLGNMLEERARLTNRRAIVVSIDSLGDKSIDLYAFELSQHWKIGEWPGEAGAILLVADSERQVRIEFGPPVRGSMIDVRSSQMVQRVILPAFRAGEFEIGLREGIDEMFTMLDTGVAQASDEARHLSDLIFDTRMLVPL